MKLNPTLLPVIFLAITATLHAQNSILTQPAPATPAAEPAVASGTFEVPGYVDAATFVPAASMTGSLHSVAAQAWNNGLQNTYQLTSGGQTVSIMGTALLLQRINEIYALDYLNNLSQTQEFTDALQKSLGAKVDSAVGILSNPIGTIQSIPSGASRFFGGIGEALQGGGGGNQNEGNVVSKLTGVNKAKAQLALKLGVSPYTDNQALQDQLTSTARVIAGGGLVVGLASSAATGGAGAVLTVVGVNQTLQDSLVNTSADQQRIINRKKLMALGLGHDDADAFLLYSNFTPWQETIITDALHRIGANPKAFLDLADNAANQQDASYFQRVAQLLLQYHKTVAPIKSIRVVSGLVAGLDKAGTMVIPVSLDYAIWSERISGRVDQFHALLAGSKEIKSFALWTDGQLSTQLCDELTKRNVYWKMLALDADKNTSQK